MFEVAVSRSNKAVVLFIGFLLVSFAILIPIHVKTVHQNVTGIFFFLILTKSEKIYLWLLFGVNKESSSSHSQEVGNYFRFSPQYCHTGRNKVHHPVQFNL